MMDGPYEVMLRAGCTDDDETVQWRLFEIEAFRQFGCGTLGKRIVEIGTAPSIMFFARQIGLRRDPLQRRNMIRQKAGP